jgi:predicted TIM-barrel fold metal-dependent hydrolase
MIKDTPLVRAFWQDLHVADCPIYDMHAHMNRFYGIWFPLPSADEMVGSMKRANVRLLCFAPHAALFAPAIGNTTALEAVRRHPDCLRAYLGINPHYPEQIARDLEMFDREADAFVGIKLLPDYHRVPATAAPYEAALKFADERKLLVLVHTWGGSSCNGAEHMQTLAARYPEITLIMGHSLHSAPQDAIRIAGEFPHVYLDLCALLDNDRGVIEMFAEAGHSERMLFGTDLPWFSPIAGLGCLLSADITDEDRHNILHRNAERILAPFGGIA